MKTNGKHLQLIENRPAEPERLPANPFRAARVYLADPIAPRERCGVARLRPGWCDFSSLDTEGRGCLFVSYPERRIDRVEFLVGDSGPTPFDD